MNCKIGDLARIVSIEEGHYGKIVRVVASDPDPLYAGFWVVDPPLPRPESWGGGYFISVQDRYLRPIADPGEHEVDERDVLVKQPEHA